MIFNSFQFIWLFPLIFIIYWVCRRFNRPHFTLSKYILLAISYGVYMQWSVFFGLVLLFVSAITFTGALAIERHKKQRRLIIWVSVLATLAPLLVCKYFNFISRSGASVLAWIGVDATVPEISFLVPLGLSFYTFQALGYLWDVYRGKIQAESSAVNYLLFVAFFPQILCGPISKAESLLPQLRTPRIFSYSQGVSGLRLILWGLFLKTVVADRLGLYVDTIYADYTRYSGISSIVAAVFYSLQIYGDFAGYSYIAAGAARLLGIDLIINFRRPVFAQSISDFWKRWNISLTKWLTDYVYIPLGGSRKGKLRTYINIMITFLVSGIWHGANWTFIFWGLLHGGCQVVEKAVGINKVQSHGIVRLLRTAATFIIVTIAWVYFRMPSIESANALIAHMTAAGSLYIETQVFGYGSIGVIVLLVLEYLMEIRPRLYRSLSLGGGAVRILRWAVYLNLLALIVLTGVLDSGQFIYVMF